MSEVIVFPDIVEIVLDYLNDALALPMGTKVPSPRPAEFVVARRVGGVRTSLVTDAALLAIECWATSPAAASDLAEQCRSLLLAMAGTVQGDTPIYQVDDVAGPGDLPDPLSDQPRYTFTVSVSYRGEPA